MLRREKLVEVLKNKYKDNPKKLKQVEKIEKNYIKVLDH
jgi:hypothetical protein